MAHNLIELAVATGDTAYRGRAEELLSAFSGAMAQSPRGSVHMVHALARFVALPPVMTEPPASRAIEIKGPPSDMADSGATAIADSSAHVKVEAGVEPGSALPGETVTVTVTLRIDDGWHVNANPASADFLIATVVDVRAVGPAGADRAPAIEVADIAYPEASRLKADGRGADAIDVYGGAARVTVKVRLPRDATPGAATPLRVLAKFQACSDAGVCLIPAEWSGELSVGVK